MLLPFLYMLAQEFNAELGNAWQYNDDVVLKAHRIMVLDAWEFYYPCPFLNKNNTNSMLRDNKFISLNINDIVSFRINLFG